jgi:hypothetical protein
LEHDLRNSIGRESIFTVKGLFIREPVEIERALILNVDLVCFGSLVIAEGGCKQEVFERLFWKRMGVEDVLSVDGLLKTVSDGESIIETEGLMVGI